MAHMLKGAMLNPLRHGLASHDNPFLAVNYSKSSISEGGEQTHHQILKLLIEHNVPRHHVDKKGNDALMQAAKASDEIAVSILLEAGTRIGQTNKKGQNALQLALSNPDLPIEYDSSQIFRLLCEALLRQGNHLIPLYDLLVQQKDPVRRDMCAYFLCASAPAGIPNIGSLLLQEKNLMAQSIQAHILSSGEGQNQFKRDLPMSLARIGITTPLINLLTPSLLMLRQIRVELFGTNIAGTEDAFQSAVDGIYLGLDPRLSQLDNEIYADYFAQHIDEQWTKTLADHSIGWLSERIDSASSNEQTQIASVFGNLYSICAAIALAGKSYPDALKLPAMPRGEIASALLHHGVYAALATHIETAWINAWQRVAEQPNLEQIERNALNEVEVDLFDDPWALPEIPNWLEALPADIAPQGNFVSPLEEALLSEFRTELKSLVDSPSTSGNLLRVTNVSPEAAALYSDLMFRQLHMLAQFIHPERTTE